MFCLITFIQESNAFKPFKIRICLFETQVKMTCECTNTINQVSHSVLYFFTHDISFDCKISIIRQIPFEASRKLPFFIRHFVFNVKKQYADHVK